MTELTGETRRTLRTATGNLCRPPRWLSLAAFLLGCDWPLEPHNSLGRRALR